MVYYRTLRRSNRRRIVFYLRRIFRILVGMETITTRFLNSIATVLIVLAPTQILADDGEYKSTYEQGGIDKKTWSVNFGGYIESSLSAEENFDLNEDKSKDISSHEAELRFNLLLVTGNQFNVYLETELSQLDFIENETNKGEKGVELTIDELYFDIFDEPENFTLRVGRQTFKDDMEWLYDADLDGLRLFYNG